MDVSVVGHVNYSHNFLEAKSESAPDNLMDKDVTQSGEAFSDASGIRYLLPDGLYLLLCGLGGCCKCSGRGREKHQRSSQLCLL